MASKAVVGGVIAAVLVLGAGVFLVGRVQGGPSVGRWVMATMPAGVPEDEGAPAIIEGMELDLRGNGTFRMNGFPAYEGRWSEAEGRITLRSDQMGQIVLERQSRDRLKQIEPKTNTGTFYLRRTN